MRLTMTLLTPSLGAAHLTSTSSSKSPDRVLVEGTTGISVAAVLSCSLVVAPP